MKIIQIDYLNPDPESIQTAANTIESGGVVIYPSDTSYGLAADSLDKKALEKLNLIKGPERQKPVSSNVRNIDMIGEYAHISPQNKDILTKYLPGPFTFILPARIPGQLPGDNPSFRIPGIPTTNALSNILNIPYTATSANPTGKPAAYKSIEVIEYFDNAEYQPDLFLDAGDLPENPGSTVVDLTTIPPTILRQESGKFEL